MKETGHGIKCYDVINPYGHDVTVVLAGDSEPSCPDVSIEKSASIAGVDLDEEIDYTIEVTNTGDCELTGVEVTENIPTVDDGEGGTVQAFSVVAADPGPPIASDGTLTWVIDTPLAPSATIIITLTVVFDEPLADGQEIVNTACVSAEGLDEPVCSSAEVAMGEEPDDTGAGSPGFWCNRIRLAADEKPGATYTTEQLEELLALVYGESEFFGQDEEAMTTEQAELVLCNPRDSSAAERLVRHLLTLWLNVVSLRIEPSLELDELCAGDEQLPDDVEGSTTVADVLEGAELDLMDLEAERATLLRWKDIIDFINNASLADGDDCADAEPLRVETRRGRRLRRH
jgi:uncharacterized repeat protein (TIGR01451 family)